MSCISVFYIALFCWTLRPLAPGAAGRTRRRANDADALYAARAEPRQRAARGSDLGRSACSAIRAISSRRGSWPAPATGWAAMPPRASASRCSSPASPPARAAVALEPDKPEGHFWLAANMGALAESFGLRQGLKYRGTIKDELLIVLKLDPAFQEGSADRALGRWYCEGARHVRWLDVEGRGTSAPLAARTVRNSTASHFFLAETADRRASAATKRAPSSRRFSTRRSIPTGRRRIGSSSRRRRRRQRLRCKGSMRRP